MLPTYINTIDQKNNNSTAHTFNLQSSNRPRPLKGNIRGSDLTDYSQFKIGQRSSVGLLLSHQQHPVRVQLLNYKQQFVQPICNRKKATLQPVLNLGTDLIHLTESNFILKNYHFSFSKNPYHYHSPPIKSSPDTTPSTNTPSIQNPSPVLKPLGQYYRFKYSYGNGDYYTGYGYSQAATYKQGQDLFDTVVNETGFKGEYQIISVENSVDTSKTNQVFVDYYYDIERKSGYKPFSGFGNRGLGSELGYLNPKDRGTYFGEKFYEADTPILLGVSTADYWGDQSIVESQLNRLGTESGKRLSMGSLFIDIEDSNPDYNIPTQLNNLLNNGYTGFMQLMSHQKIADVLNGSVDAALQRFAKAYATWVSKGENRSTWIAPFPEMNGTWETYSADPQSFKQAYGHIQEVFKAAGVPDQSVRWVFAPNGWSTSDRSFEAFYPGADVVDAVAFSSFNWGYSEAAGYKAWQTPTEVFDPYIQRLRTMAPDKPIFITQTGTTSVTATGSNLEVKDQWLKDAYTYFAGAPGVRGVLYFNLNKETDWSLFYDNGQLSTGYQTAVKSSAFDYISPAELAQTQLIPNPSI